ncbi:ATP-grasp domain-containing protein [Umezawaea sp. Da 62-37]|uniref:ATP-grasp domain-containing protein n=1 Tax=Umezawaea sp. Da 62-37 TaxID=3075927 RepID=UPI0028F6C618|nr:ATP-grasp domain-containing protein [Umezawaea sp. Da 62-37]WNV85807.1 ATP-grasp domain-containing protein [Umezawaea sp. Da 62-37]
MTNKRLVLIGSGGAAFREYALRAISRKADIVLVSDAPPRWETAYLADSLLVDLSDHEAVLAAVRDVTADGLLTYDERYVELTARLTAELGFRGPGVDAVRAVKDKSAFRALQQESGLAPIRFGVAETPEQAREVLRSVGLPAVFKPRALGGSAGVAMVTTDDEVDAAFEVATSARVGIVKSRYDGVLIEEYVDGPEISVDSVTFGGVTTPLVVAEKQTGLAPYFEEIGHVVPAPDALAPPEVYDLVRKAHALAGLDDVVTHTEVRLGPDGPRIIELNARLGGDLIPYLGLLAHGVDLASAAADIALGDAPAIDRRDLGSAAVRFLYPATDIRLNGIALPDALAERPELDSFAVLGSVGAELLLPPRGYMSRLAVVVVTGASREAALDAALEISTGVEVDADELAVAGTAR